MRKKKELKTLEFLQVVPPYRKLGYERGEALKMSVDWRDSHRDKSIIYRDNDSNKYKISRVFSCSEKDVSEMMLMEDEASGILKEGRIEYVLERPIVFAELKTRYEVEKVIAEKGKSKVVKARPISELSEKVEGDEIILRIDKIGRLK